MLKKLALLSTLCLSLPVSYADNLAPYVGAGLGVQVNTASSGSNYRGVPFNVLAGYGGVINQNFYLAGEFNATLFNAEMNNNYGNIKTSYSYGLSAIPGLMLSDHTMLFGRAGLLQSRFSTNTSRTGGVLGLGLQTLLTQDVDIRGEYNYVSFGSFTNNARYYGAPRSDIFNLSLIYKFQ